MLALYLPKHIAKPRRNIKLVGVKYILAIVIDHYKPHIILVWCSNTYSAEYMYQVKSRSDL